MSILNVAVAIASGVTGSLGFKSTVTHTPWIGQDGRGGDSFGTPVSRLALVDLTKRQHFTASGVLVMVYATVTFLDPIEDTTPNSPWTRDQPIDARDIITLGDGTTAPIQQTGAFQDGATNRPLFSETILGHPVGGN